MRRSLTDRLFHDPALRVTDWIAYWWPAVSWPLLVLAGLFLWNIGC